MCPTMTEETMRLGVGLGIRSGLGTTNVCRTLARETMGLGFGFEFRSGSGVRVRVRYGEHMCPTLTEETIGTNELLE